MNKIKFALVLIFVICIDIFLIASPQVTQPVPVHDYSYTCQSPNGGPKFTMLYKDYPFQSIQTVLNNPPASTDTVSPVIVGVTNSANLSLLTNTVGINPTLNGLPVTVSAGDNVGIRDASLYVDGNLVTMTSSVNDVLPAVFYLRWNARAISPGIHAFKLSVWDAAGNVAEKNWTMVR